MRNLVSLQWLDLSLTSVTELPSALSALPELECVLDGHDLDKDLDDV
jgi:hypothetical protein